MNLPNKLSILRIILVPVFVALFFINIPEFPYFKFLSLGVFVLASFTDFLDGYIARKYKMVTTVGNFLDTIADKMLITCAMICVAVDFAGVGMREASAEIYALMVIVAVCAMLNVCRDLIISALKMIASSKNVTISADKLGKVKMFLQTISLIALIPFRDIALQTPGDITAWTMTAAIILLIGVGLLVIASIMALISGVHYIVKYRYVFQESAQPSTQPEVQESAQADKEELS